jgi:hypothetical protein
MRTEEEILALLENVKPAVVEVGNGCGLVVDDPMKAIV